jgi:hypothetical protein
MRDVLAVAKDVLAAFQNAGIECVLGGALAFGYWGVARGTKDIDITVFLEPNNLSPAFEVLDKLDAVYEGTHALDLARKRGVFDVSISGIRVDVFLPDIQLYDSARARTRRVRFQDLDVLIWSAEDIALFKLLFFREKDRSDVRTILEVQQQDLDLGYIREWLHDMVGPEDERSKWFEQAILLAIH